MGTLSDEWRVVEFNLYLIHITDVKSPFIFTVKENCWHIFVEHGQITECAQTHGPERSEGLLLRPPQRVDEAKA